MINLLSASSSSSSSPSQSKGVIRAVNVPVTQSSCSHDGIERKKEDIIKKLNLLETLHVDTFAITEHLLSSTTASSPNQEETKTSHLDFDPSQQSSKLSLPSPSIVFSRFSKADQHLLAATFEQIRSRHASTVENMADIVTEWREYNHQVFPKNKKDDHPLVEQFLKDRLGIQLLCDHYVGLSKDKKGGGVSINVDFHQVLLEAITESNHVCDANFGIVPQVHIISNDDDKNQVDHVTLVRPWVHHALVELFKNGMASSVQKMMELANRHNPPDLFVRVCSHRERDVMICEIIDQGVGIQEEKDLQRAFQFATSSSRQRWDRIQEQQSYAMVRSPISSLGVGLPLSRMMMQKFGGDVTLKYRSKPIQIGSIVIDTGCTACLHLPLRDGIEEVL
jgi:Osmosensitive K+ channel histidine kinase